MTGNVISGWDEEMELKLSTAMPNMDTKEILFKMKDIFMGIGYFGIL